jgi:hypothetical protein
MDFMSYGDGERRTYVESYEPEKQGNSDLKTDQ